MRPAPYSAHEIFVAPARARPQLWRLLVTLAVAALAFFGLNSAVGAILSRVFPDLWWTIAQDGVTGTTPVGLLFILYWFGIMAVATGLAVRVVQGRSPAGLIGPWRLFLGQFIRVFGAVLVLSIVVAALPPYDYGGPLKPNLAFGLWASLLPLAIPAIFVQVATEEIVFRGFLQQSLAARFRQPVIWLCLPSALFAAGHYAPTDMGDTALLYVGWTFAFGVMMADLTARAGTLGPAIAIHFVNNLAAILLVSLPDSLNGLALYLVPYDLSEGSGAQAWLMVDFAAVIVMWLTARVVLRR
ncbi:CPBP family intramembrane glutamic endopeptidase [Chachezhania antarctica]|uniref:CPBP family intramembrane glutamic endopeptidase n=1 Tax=Chachezhania antarctica TaxID=2340860 RepID=UPI001F0949F5|nr:CPBP family intramembrane glutamic endopeptidase [Chachezhania antarctica]